jgi:hypothetical protein
MRLRTKATAASSTSAGDRCVVSSTRASSAGTQGATARLASLASRCCMSCNTCSYVGGGGSPEGPLPSAAAPAGAAATAAAAAAVADGGAPAAEALSSSSLWRLCARTAMSAVTNSLAVASGHTTVPTSRPSSTAPAACSRRPQQPADPWVCDTIRAVFYAYSMLLCLLNLLHAALGTICVAAVRVQLKSRPHSCFWVHAPLPSQPRPFTAVSQRCQ